MHFVGVYLKVDSYDIFEAFFLMEILIFSGKRGKIKLFQILCGIFIGCDKIKYWIAPVLKVASSFRPSKGTDQPFLAIEGKKTMMHIIVSKMVYREILQFVSDKCCL